MHRFLAIGLLVSVLLMPEYYLLDTPYRLANIFMILLLGVWLADRLVILDGGLGLDRGSGRILAAAYLLMTYVFVSDLLKNDPGEALRLYLPNLLIPMMLPVFRHLGQRFDVRRAFLWVFGFSLLFALAQVAGFRTNLNMIFPGFGPLMSDGIVDPAVIEGSRVSGAVFSIIGFAECLGFALILGYFAYQRSRRKVLIPVMAVMVAVLFLTQTRSAIYGLVPSVFLVELLFGGRKVRSILRALSLVVAVTLAAVYLSDLIEQRFYRLKDPLDASVLERIQTNYYATIGVWNAAPVTGIPKEKAWEVISETASERDLVVGDLLRVTRTHHNQVLYYFRYYGLIGVALLLLLFLCVFQKLRLMPPSTDKLALISIFVFDLQYSMGHNVKLINNVLLWVFLSLAWTGAHRDEGPAQERAGGHA